MFSLREKVALNSFFFTPSPVHVKWSLQAFINNFQEAKEALAEVTVHAAEKAASGVKGLAERSTRIALNVHFNAPVIFLPQSSSSINVIVADLGRLSVKNRFDKKPFKSDSKIPPVVDIMTVKLSDLKMYRSEAGRVLGHIFLILQSINEN